MTTSSQDIKPAENPNHLYETVKTIVVAALFALAIRSVAFEPFSIPSGSMVPTLLVGDYLFVAKYSYGYSKYSFPLAMFPIEGRIKGEEPKRGDVIVFRKPTNVQIDFIKRLIGLPGDKIQVRKGRLYINGKMLKREFIGNYESSLGDGSIAMHRRYWETLPDGKKHLIIERGDDGPLDNTQVYTVPEGHYFMMGDNRDGSQDSRVLQDVGYVPFENLIGRATYLFFSVDENANAWEFWRWPWTVRFKRIADHID